MMVLHGDEAGGLGDHGARRVFLPEMFCVSSKMSLITRSQWTGSGPYCTYHTIHYHTLPYHTLAYHTMLSIPYHGRMTKSHQGLPVDAASRLRPLEEQDTTIK